MQNVQHWDSDDEVENYLERILRREVGDKSGLIYGIGHAIYTLSDPRAVELKKQARSLAAKTGYADQFALYERIERLAPDAFHKVTGNEKVVCANVDFYSGLVYEMLGIPEDSTRPCSPFRASPAGAPTASRSSQRAAASSARRTARCPPVRPTSRSRTVITIQSLFCK